MEKLEAFLTGRLWLREFTPFPAEEIDRCILEQKISVVKGIKENRECARCLEKSSVRIVSFHCEKCKKRCYYCRQCINMGRISSCTELITWADPSHNPSYAHSFSWNGALTPSQQRASDEVCSSISEKRSHLVYAVCGAGKTELLFSPVFQALKKGWRVCIAAPRTDVVLELSPRFRKVFPDTTIHTIYGGSAEEEGFASLILCTVHQLYRFQDAFDLIILDEADAFPYSYDPALERALLKAKKQNAPTICVSATPSERLLKTIPHQSKIFNRYHGHPLPVPVYASLWNYRKTFHKHKIPEKLKAWVLERIEKKEAFLLFFPTIELIDQVTPLFKALDGRIEAVHSKDSGRKEKVMQLRNGEIPGVLTSTILERGITIPNIQVAVIGAEGPVFDASALVQIAGRVGRSAEFPSGKVVFFHNGITKEMDRARYKIISYNKGGG